MTITITEITKETKEVPEEVRCSRFGCGHCLWSSIECPGGALYVPQTYSHLKRGCKTKMVHEPTCGNYAYND